MIPKDPVILLSYVNTQLRDYFVPWMPYVPLPGNPGKIP